MDCANCYKTNEINIIMLSLSLALKLTNIMYIFKAVQSGTFWFQNFKKSIGFGIATIWYQKKF